MEELYIPSLSAFRNKNSFLGSYGPMRFKLVPEVMMASAKEVDDAASCIHAEFWHGPLCYELSEIEANATFPMSEEGRTAIRAWLLEHV